MSTDYEAGVILGWHLDIDQFFNLCEERRAILHTEKRFDPKTGEPTEPEVITDEPGGPYWHGVHIAFRDQICQVVGDWFEENGIELDIAPVQNQGGFMKGVLIGRNVEAVSAGDANRLLDKKSVIAAKQNFKVQGLPLILPYLVVC